MKNPFKPKAKPAAPVKATPAPKKPASPKPTNDAPKDEAVLQAAYQQGRKARHTGIGRTDAPHGDGHDLEAWLKGWDYEDSL